MRSYKAKEMQIIRKCPVCKNDFIVSLNRKLNNTYCSHKCANIATGKLRYNSNKHIKHIKPKPCMA